MSVYGLKQATPRMKYQHMNYMLDWRADLKDLQASPPDRHIALERIKKLMADSLAFNTWYDQVYKLRRVGKADDYEQAIFAMLAELMSGKEKRLERFWLGKRHQGDLVRFSCMNTPTRDTHGHRYTAVIGPFKTILGAEFYRRYGQGNPHIVTVDDAERLALECNEGAWPLIREQLQIEMNMLAQESSDFLGDLAAEYDPN
jgi:hypothetical protein